jgi:molecular chaperone GrpE
MNETQRHHARQRAAAQETPPRQEEPVEGPAATFERTQEPEDGASAPQAEPAPPEEAQVDWEAQANEYLEQWRRTAADFANFKRRTEQERAELAKMFNEGLVKALLPVLDNFERALASVPEDLKGHSWVEGITLTEKQLRAALEREGLRAIEAVGQRFDPNLHEAVAHDVSEEHEEDSVIEEFQKGYKLHDRVIRPSMVKVSRRS